ncbi:MAG: cytochrome b/b6 domain-containing protein [Rubrivivax sp.]|nr:cytochrome b/b6 domain-containing protein [Rubrivivax sp.]
MSASPDSPAAAAPARPAQALLSIRVWDLPTRLFHWLLAACVIGLVITGNIGGNAMIWHFRLGYAVLALLLFRIVWGLVGGRWSRFASFVRGPQTVLRYLRGQAADHEHLDVGHNPLGAFSVLAMLAVLALQVACGLVADDEIANVGPLNRFVSSELAELATGWHKGPGKLLILALVLLHIGAIIFYRVRKQQNLVQPMLLGDKQLPPGTPQARDDRVTRAGAMLLFLAALAAAVLVASLAP